LIAQAYTAAKVIVINVRNIPSGNGAVYFIQDHGTIPKLDTLNGGNRKGFNGCISQRDNQILGFDAH
jgi:hypothetical protein